MVHGKEPDPIAARAIDTYWVTVIDHGMNASTFAARVIASTRSDIVSAVTGAIGALKGPLHGGAPGPVLDMLKDIRSADRAEAWVRNELAAGRRIMGFGHRVYKVRDPRADVLSKVADEMASAKLEDRRLFDLARHVEQTALKVLERMKPGRNLRTNVEFYTALVLQSLGLSPRARPRAARLRPGAHPRLALRKLPPPRGLRRADAGFSLLAQARQRQAPSHHARPPRAAGCARGARLGAAAAGARRARDRGAR